MALSKKSKTELLAEVRKLERELKSLQKKQHTANRKQTLPLKDSKWESFFKNSANTILVIDRKGTILDINKLANPASKKKILGKTAYDFVSEDVVKKMKQAIMTVFKTKKSQLYDSWRIDEKGRPNYYRSKVTAIIENKKVVAAVIDATDITNEILIQNQLKQSEEKFKKLSDSAFEGIVIHQHGKIVEVNKALCKIFGYKEKQLIGQPIFKFIHSDYHSLAREKIKNKEEKEYEMVMLRKGKKPFWAEIMATGLIYNDSPARVVAIRDITANKEYEKTIKDSEERFRMLAQNAADIVFRYTLYPEFKYEYISPSVEKITGYSPENYYKDPHLGIKKIHPQDLQIIQEFQKLNRKKQVGKSEIKPMVLRWIRKDGGIIWTETVNNQIKDKTGKVIAIEGISRDITERKEAEEVLKESEEKFRMLAENASDLIYRYRVYPTNQYEYVGPSAKALTGYSPEEFYAQPMLGFKLTHPDDVHLLGDSEKLIKEKARLSNVRRSELVLRWIKKNGSVIWTETRSKPVFDAQGRLIAIEGISRDITKQKDSEERLKDSEERFKILSNVAFEGIIFSENERIIDANDQFVKMYGFKSVKEVIGKHIVEDFVLDKYKGIARKFAQLNKSEPFEVQAMHKDGTIITVEMKGQSIPYFGRNIRATVIYNITERKQYELELQQSRENYRGLVEHSPDGILIHIKDKIVFANASAEKILEAHHPGALTNHTFLDFILPAHHRVLNERIQRAMTGEQIPFIDVKAKTLKNRTIEIETQPILITYNGKQAVQILIHDTATRKQLMKEQVRAQIAEETNQKLQQEITERKNAERILQQTQKYTRLLIDSSLDMICASDKNGNITEFNAAAQRTFGYESNEIVGKHVSILYANPGERIRITNQELQNKGVFTGEVINRKKNGETFITYLSASVLRNDAGEIVGSMGVSRDISELKKAEEELKLSERKYRAIYDQAYIGIARVGLIEEDFIEVNQRLCNMLGYTSEELCKMTTSKITDSNDLHPRLPKLKAFHDTKSNIFSAEKRYVHKNGSIVYANLTTTLVKDATGKPQYFVSVYEDITERKKSEESIRTQSAKHNAIIESSSHLIWTVDKNYCLTSFNRNFNDHMRNRYGIDAKIGLGLSMTTGDAALNEENKYWINKYDHVLKGKTQYFETKMIDKHQNLVWREIYLNPIVDEKGNVTEISGIGHDITEKKLADEKIRQSLQEKEVLLKEVHHRVKNNLQVISSILNLQSSYVKDTSTLNILKESQNRIKSMAFIHESLYQTKDFSSINFSEYVVNLSHNLIHSYANFDHEIKLNLDIQNVFLNLDLAIPCGLIINEIVSNALKYAFIDNSEDGEITIRMYIQQDELILIIGDNGIGLPSDIDYRNTESLGLQLVVTLTDQLNGSIELDRRKGTVYTVIFKQNQIKNRI